MENILISPNSVLSAVNRIIPTSESVLKQTGEKLNTIEGGEVGGGGGRVELREEVSPFLEQDMSNRQYSNVRRETEEGGGGMASAAVNSSPKKRVIMFSAFLACLSCILILCNLIISFANDLLRDDAFLKLFQKYLKESFNNSSSNSDELSKPDGYLHEING